MKTILLTQATMVEGTFREAEWMGEVEDKTARTLHSMGKACIEEEEESVSVALSVDIANTEEFKRISEDLEIRDNDLARQSNTISNLEEEIETLEKESLKTQKKHWDKLDEMLDDIRGMSQKQLREKYASYTPYRELPINDAEE